MWVGGGDQVGRTGWELFSDNLRVGKSRLGQLKLDG